MIANAADNSQVAKVEFYDGTKLIGSETAAPYTETWNATSVPLGKHTLTARAIDAVGNVTDSKPIIVTVVAPPPDKTAPKVAFASPSNGAVFPGDITVKITATDNAQLERIEVLDGTAKVFAVAVAGTSAAVTSIVHTTAAGSHKLTARAYDKAGNSASATVTVTVDKTQPTVNITAPANKAKVSGNVSITASASDNVAVARVEFSVAGVVRCTDLSAPYSCAWTVPAGSGKSYVLQATAFDTVGNSRASTAVTVTAK
jgi:hypothetical protein